MAIEGTPGRDYLYGTTASDTLIGKGGDDELYGYAGNDSYLFSAFDGDDYVSDSAGIDRVVFDATVSRSDIRLATEYYGDLIVMNEDTGDELRLDGQFDGGPYRIEKISFADGSSIDLTAPLTFTGDVEGNSIYATSGNDTLIGKGGNDNLYGGAGGDTYVFGPYDGRDYIDDSGGPDGIRFEAGVRFAELSFLNDGFNDLLIRNGSTADVIEINNQFVAGTNRVETLSFADGSRYAGTASSSPGSAEARSLVLATIPSPGQPTRTRSTPSPATTPFSAKAATTS